MPEDGVDQEGIEDELPPEVEAMEALAAIMAEGDPEERIEALAKIVKDHRHAAVTARAGSGIEKIWREDIDYYEGRDDFNRGTELTKGQSLTGVVQTNEAINDEDGCTEFFNITRPFVDAADARMGDILLPAGDWNFSIDNTPIPDLVEAINDTSAVTDPDTGLPVNKPGTEDPATMGDVAQNAIIEAGKKVKRAELWIRDQLTECRYHAESRLVISDAAKIGTGVIKGPFPARRKSIVVLEGERIVKISTGHASKRIDPFNFFPDPNCGDDIQSGSYTFERDYMSARQLRELPASQGYREEAIAKVLKEGPGKEHFDSEGNHNGLVSPDDTRYEVWYFHGDIKVSDLKLLDGNVEDDTEETEDSEDVKSKSDDGEDYPEEDYEEPENFVSGTIVMVNDSIIKGYLSPDQSGEFPYDVFPWQKIAGQIWGIGVARQGRVPQKMFLASSRALMNNMSLSSAPMVGVLQHAVVPADGDWTLRAGKMFLLRENSDVRSLKDAITTMAIPSMQAEMTANIQLALKMMEDATGVTFLLQGQQGAAPDTVGGMQMLQQNASAFLRRVARLYDEYVTERHITRYYKALLEHGPDDAKGDMRVQALGSSALLERETQALQAQQLMMLAQDPTFELSRPKVAHEMLRLWKVEPAKFKMDEEELKAAKEAQPQPAPQVEAAKIRTDGAIQQAQIKADTEAERIRKDTDRDALYAAGVTERNQMANEMKSRELEMKLQLAMLEFANKNEMQLADVKMQLSKEAMKLSTQKELSEGAKPAAQVATPAVEPVGRAPDGQAFQK